MACSITDPNPRDRASNDYREQEKINVRSTIQVNPLLGVGFGQEFLFVVPLPDISKWPFWRYEPHHNILWVWLKTGAFGFMLFWVWMGSAIARAAYFVRACSFATSIKTIIFQSSSPASRDGSSVTLQAKARPRRFTAST